MQKDNRKFQQNIAFVPAKPWSLSDNQNLETIKIVTGKIPTEKSKDIQNPNNYTVIYW